MAVQLPLVLSTLAMVGKPLSWAALAATPTIPAQLIRAQIKSPHHVRHSAATSYDSGTIVRTLQ